MKKNKLALGFFFLFIGQMLGTESDEQRFIDLFKADQRKLIEMGIKTPQEIKDLDKKGEDILHDFEIAHAEGNEEVLDQKRIEFINLIEMWVGLVKLVNVKEQEVQ